MYPILLVYLSALRSIRFAASDGTPTLAESLKLLQQWQEQQAPPLPNDLLAYLSAQARFVVAMARQYQTQGMAWPRLLDAGQRGLIRAWEVSQNAPSRLDRMSAWWVRKMMIRQTRHADTTDALDWQENSAGRRSSHWGNSCNGSTDA